MSRSTRLRSRYTARLNGPRRRSSRRWRIVTRIPRRRKARRIAPVLYALSPTARLGRRRGRPRPGRCTAYWAIKAGVSCHWPGVRTNVSGSAPPSARRCNFVLNPPWLRPSASVAGSSPLPPRRAGAPARRWCRDNADPDRAGRPHRSLLEARPARWPRPRPAASGRSGWRRSATGHSAPASPATARRAGRSRECRLALLWRLPGAGPRWRCRAPFPGRCSTSIRAVGSGPAPPNHRANRQRYGEDAKAVLDPSNESQFRGGRLLIAALESKPCGYTACGRIRLAFTCEYSARNRPEVLCGCCARRALS